MTFGPAEPSLYFLMLASLIEGNLSFSWEGGRVGLVRETCFFAWKFMAFLLAIFCSAIYFPSGESKLGSTLREKSDGSTVFLLTNDITVKLIIY